MKRFMIYIAGPISKGDLADNINRATAAFKTLAEAGLAPLCPQWSCFSTGALHGYIGAGVKVYAEATAGGCGLSHQHWLEVDLEFVGRSDAVLRLPGESKGADMETAFAREHGIPVFESVPALLEWARQS